MENDHLSSVLEVFNPSPGARPWHGGPTVMGALRGVKAEQAVWKPTTNRKSIWELALHIAYWNYTVRRYFDPDAEKGFPRSPSNFPLPVDQSESAWRDDKALISDEHTKLVLAIQAFPDDRWDEKTDSPKQWTYRQLFVGITVHDAYHTGQIQLMKRLYQEQAQAKKEI